VTGLLRGLSGRLCFLLLSAVWMKRPGPLLLYFIRNSPVVVADTVDPAVCVHAEGLALQAPSADHTAKAGRVVGLPTSLQNLTSKTSSFYTM